MKQKPILFSIRSYKYLLERISQHCDFDLGEVEVKAFPDGERYQRIITKVEERDVILIGGTINDSDTLEMYDLACSMSKARCQEPYLDGALLCLFDDGAFFHARRSGDGKDQGPFALVHSPSLPWQSNCSDGPSTRRR